ncbi:MAG: dinitrogenase iron-molybdenum cofactor biosynthesis protein [Gammaproteobacteria bacterium]|nr:MAG: dinitrogenase iron-molybdenum cofactor biosynthesis protein [Gammaproteobacteria bacterium]
MSDVDVGHEVALRIGLAARELPNTDVARLFRVLADVMVMPPTVRSLSMLTGKRLRSALDGELADIDPEAMKRAVALLRGDTGATVDPLPGVQAFSEGDMPNSIRVACASNRGEMLDGHFGSCHRFLVYQVSALESRLVEIRAVDPDREQQDKNGYRTDLVSDCQILFVASIGGPAAARVVRAGVHPVKKPEMGSAADEIQSLQKVLGADAPPWLAKVMGQAPEERIRFVQDADA